MMSESIDETLDKDEAEEETEELTNQVKIGIFSFSLQFCFALVAWYVIVVSCIIDL